MYLDDLFGGSGLTPHGFCLLWRPGQIWLQVASDAIIALAYYSIPPALAYFVWRRDDLVFGWIFWLFAGFILACGTTHVMEIWTLWHPDYLAQGLVKAATALLSIVTAMLLWPLVPRALAIPSAETLRGMNADLSVQVAERNAAVEALRREMIERQRAEEALRQAQKMEGLGQLTGGVAHDFNNLLLILRGNLHLVGERTGGELAKSLAAMDRALDRGESLTRQLLSFARRQSLQPRLIDFGEEMPKLVELLQRSLRGDIEIEVSLASDLWTTVVDPSELELALINVASNARDAMASGGTISILLANERLVGTGVDGLVGEFVRIAVVDNGPGIPADLSDRVFEPFFTTKEPGRGTGLGLSQVYGFARQSGGTATAGNRPEGGAVITLFLPRSDVAMTGSILEAGLAAG